MNYNSAGTATVILQEDMWLDFTLLCKFGEPNHLEKPNTKHVYGTQVVVEYNFLIRLQGYNSAGTALQLLFCRGIFG